MDPGIAKIVYNTQRGNINNRIHKSGQGEREKYEIMKPWATDRPTAGMTGNNDAINVFFFSKRTEKMGEPMYSVRMMFIQNERVSETR